MSTNRSTGDSPQCGSPTTDSPGWAQHLDALKQMNGLTSDLALAAFLGVTRSFISAVRTGRKNVSAELGERIFALLGKTVSAEDVEIFKPLRVQRRTPSAKRVDARAAASARARAAGHCELCGAPAPFQTPDGDPYLEIHLVIPLDKGGANSVSNMVALCPNCNRRIAICGPTEQDVERLRVATNRT